MLSEDQALPGDETRATRSAETGPSRATKLWIFVAFAAIPVLIVAIVHFRLSAAFVAGTGHGLLWWFVAIGQTVLGVVAIVGGWIALKSYVANNAAASHAHMHQMFMRFLEVRDERINRENAAKAGMRVDQTHEGLDPDAKISSLREDLDFGGAALYYLEEVHAWIRKEEDARRTRYYPLLFKKRERLIHRDILESWKATIATQLTTHRDDVLKSLKSYTNCYGATFLMFAAQTFAKTAEDFELSQAAAVAEAAMLAGQSRPLGTIEPAHAAPAAPFHQEDGNSLRPNADGIRLSIDRHGE